MRVRVSSHSLCPQKCPPHPRWWLLLILGLPSFCRQRATLPAPLQCNYSYCSLSFTPRHLPLLLQLPEDRGNASAILRVISILNKVPPPPTSRDAQPLVEEGMAGTRATRSPNRQSEQSRCYWGYTKVANEGCALGEFTFRELSKSNRLKWDNINHSKSVWLRLWAEELREF